MSNGIFSYFIPGLDRDAATRSKILTLPFAAVIGDALKNERTFQAMCVVHHVAKGPSGSSGVLICARHPAWPDAHRVGFYPEGQTWRDCGEYWLGYVTNNKPGPDSLQREPLVSGYDYELGDERIWHTPMLRYPAGSPNLPQTMGVDPAGQFVESVVDPMKWAWSLACDIWDRYVMGDGIKRPEVFEKSVQCLGVNYRVGPQECSVLGLIDGPKSQLILQAAVAGPLIDELMSDDAKKNQPVSP